MKKLIIAISIIILLLIFPIYQLYALNAVSVQNFQIQRMMLNNHLQFEVEGSLELYNPSTIPITIKEIMYTATIDNEEVFNGTIAATTIASMASYPITFKHTINWIPNEETLQNILAGEDVTMVIETRASSAYLMVFTLKREKTIKINITQMIRPSIEEYMRSVTKMLAGLIF